MATSKIQVTEGTGKNLATNSFTEDAVTKEVSRVTINEADGTDTAVAAKLGALTETAPASDTASSGINGRLQRIAQRLTSTLVDGANATLGANADAASLTGSVSAKLRGIATALGVTALDLGSGTGGSRTLRFFKDTAQWIGGAGANGTAVQRVTVATDDALNTGVGSLTETAPASDTASSGLNGRLQRLAQRITSMMADGGLTTLGAKADAANSATDTTAITAMSVFKQLSVYLKTISDNVVALGRKTQPNSMPVVLASFEYETVAVSQTDQIMGATGGVGDFLEGVLCVVGTAATSEVKIKDGNGTAITILNNAVGAGIGTYYIPIGLLCANATTPGWKITTAAGVTAIGIGKFT